MTVGIDEGSRLSAWVSPFRPLFTHPTWQRVLVLIEGAVLAPHRRTISAALRAAGKDEDAGFARYHAVLNRCRWSALAASRLLFVLLIDRFAASGAGGNRPRRHDRAAMGRQDQGTRHLSRPGVARQSGCDSRGDQDETDRVASVVIMAAFAATVQAVSSGCVAARQSAEVLIVARVGGRPGPRLRSIATRLR